MGNRNISFLLAFIASFIYGVSFTIAKDVMPLYIKPFGFILFRVAGATILFWLISSTVPKEKIHPKDFIKVLLAAFFGIALNMLTFFKGLSLTTPINGAVIMTTSPIIVMIFSFFILKEPITIRRSIGIVIGMIGAVLIIMFGPVAEVNAPNMKLGNLLVFINAASFSMYLIVAKPMLAKYHPFTFIKWMYLFGLIMVLPFGLNDVLEMSFDSIPVIAYYKIGFIVIFTTFITYLINLIALKNLKPTTLSVFLYLQPLIASIYAVSVGSDTLTPTKIVATALIFIGVYVVSSKTVSKV
jgi:drug/metabolite transporter (DMT)-like permease